MKPKIGSQRMTIFLFFTFGITWLLDLAIYLMGGLSNLKPGTPTWFLSSFAMVSPALATVLTRMVTREGWNDTYLRLHFKQIKCYWLAAWVGTPILLLLGMGIFYVLIPQYFDSSFSAVNKLLARAAQQTGKATPLSPHLFLMIQIFQVILIAPIFNSIATFGEEFGWRAYLLEKFMPLGGRTALLIMGVIWGIWHWPFIYMGYEYGFYYPVVFLWFTFIIGTFLAWLTPKSRSVWPAVIAHAALNGIASLALLLVKGQPNPLFGPTEVRLVASRPFTILGLALFLRSEVFLSTDVLTGKSDVVQHPVI
jgi:uncharacterized protein